MLSTTGQAMHSPQVVKLHRPHLRILVLHRHRKVPESIKIAFNATLHIESHRQNRKDESLKRKRHKAKDE